jgi:hypothetical protein
MPQIQVTNETMNRMKKILGKNKMRDGDYFVNKMIDMLEKKIKVSR